MPEFKESNYGDQHIAEDPEAMNDGWTPSERPGDFQAFGPNANMGEQANTETDQLAEVENLYQQLADSLDSQSKSIIENALNLISKFIRADHRWVKIMIRLMNDVLMPFKNNEKQFAQDNLSDLDSEIQSMAT